MSDSRERHPFPPMLAVKTYPLASRESLVHVRDFCSVPEPLPNFESPPTTVDFQVAASASEVTAAAGGTDTAPAWMAVTNQGDDIYARFFVLP